MLFSIIAATGLLGLFGCESSDVYEGTYFGYYKQTCSGTLSECDTQGTVLVNVTKGISNNTYLIGFQEVTVSADGYGHLGGGPYGGWDCSLRNDSINIYSYSGWQGGHVSYHAWAGRLD